MSVTRQLAGGPPYFSGVLVELVGMGEGYVLLETAVGTGNRLLRFSSKSPDPAYALFEAELGSSR